MQWIFTKISTNQTFDLDLHNILIMTDADDSLSEHYKESLHTFESKHFDSEEIEDFDNLEPDEGIEMLRNLMDKIKNNKGNLH